MSDNPKLILKKDREQSVRRFHPWIFSGAVRQMEDEIQEGDVVDVYSHEGEFLATGHYQAGSIAVRILSFEPCSIDHTFWCDRIARSWQKRVALGLAGSPSTDVFRLVHGEGDGLPGLVADYYSGHVVIQLHSAGMYRMKQMILDALQQVIGHRLRSVYDKSSSTLPYKAGLDQKDGYLAGSHEHVMVRENNLSFIIDCETGQKTGFYIDQRDNRMLLSSYAGGRKVLNLFGYTGGFSVYALKGGAALVHTVDTSEKAIQLAEGNVRLNAGDDAPHRGFVADCFDFLQRSPEPYDLMILDPPAFAKHGKVLSQALKGYRRLNAMALEKIAPGGIIFTFSCSQVVSRDDFRRAVFTSATLAGRNVSVIHTLGQPPDHPVNIYHPEGEYLKGLVLLVE